MMKKMMVYRWVWLFSSSLLSACSNLALTPTPQSSPMLVSPAIAYQLQASDQIQLQRQLATAPPKTITHWTNPHSGAIFTFSSLGIFVEASGKPCRRYQISMNYGVIKRTTVTQVACRMRDGQWAPQKTVD